MEAICSKTMDLAKLVRTDDGGILTLLPSWRRRFEEPFLKSDVVTMVVLLLLRVSNFFDGDFVLFYFFFSFGCVHL
jgi:hypothetical protein